MTNPATSSSITRSTAYAIGDRTHGLRRNRDGSLDIDIGHEPPPGGERANWLPAPSGPFMLALRIYRPRPEAFDEATWPMSTVTTPPPAHGTT